MLTRELLSYRIMPDYRCVRMDLLPTKQGLDFQLFRGTDAFGQSGPSQRQAQRVDGCLDSGRRAQKTSGHESADAVSASNDTLDESGVTAISPSLCLLPADALALVRWLAYHKHSSIAFRDAAC